MVEANVVERGRRCEAGDVAAQFTRLAIGPHHHGQRVPTDQRTQPPLHLRIAGHLGLAVHRNAVDVFGGRHEGQMSTGATGELHQSFQQMVRAFGAIRVDDRLQRLQPLAGFGGIEVVRQHILKPIHSLRSGKN